MIGKTLRDFECTALPGRGGMGEVYQAKDQKLGHFGLAKAYAGEQEEVNLSNSPTLSDAATQQGVTLGTAAYMNPEQARG